MGDAPVDITATFEPGVRLAVEFEGYPGFASVIYDSGSESISCSAEWESGCSYSFAPGDTVGLSLSNVHSSFNPFLYWSDAESCTGAACTISLGTDDVMVTATFANPVWTSMSGTGTGRLTSSPAGIDCVESNVSCGALYPAPGESVTLVASPDVGSVVERWTGYGNAGDLAVLDACGRATSCTVAPTSQLKVQLVLSAGI